MKIQEIAAKYAEKYEPRFRKAAAQAYEEGAIAHQGDSTKMRVTLYFGGCKDKDIEYDIEDMINYTEILLQRVPNKGERISLGIGDYWLDAKVGTVFTNYYQTGNKHWKDRVWGDNYAIYLEDIEIADYYGKHD